MSNVEAEEWQSLSTLFMTLVVPLPASQHSVDRGPEAEFTGFCSIVWKNKAQVNSRFGHWRRHRRMTCSSLAPSWGSPLQRHRRQMAWPSLYQAMTPACKQLHSFQLRIHPAFQHPLALCWLPGQTRHETLMILFCMDDLHDRHFRVMQRHRKHRRVSDRLSTSSSPPP